MNKFIAGATLVLVCGAAGLALAQAQNGQARGAYLTREQTPEAALILPPAPVEGTDRYEQDRRVFKATRALAGTPRWTLAQEDNNLTVPYLMQAFSCSAGAALTPQNAPTLQRLMSRAISDAGQSSGTAKDVFKRRRPYLIDEGDICVAKSDSLARSFDYPSGHTTLGWTVGMIFAELVPDRATQVLTRARAYGESRVVCGVHNASAIEAGRVAGSTVFAALHRSDAFKADVEAARREIEAAKASGPGLDAAKCAAEAELIAKTPYPY